MTREEILPILSKISIFGGLSDEQVGRILAKMHRESYVAGQKIIAQGEPGDRIYVVLSGQVKVVAELDGDPMELVAYSVGQCFGEISVIGILPHSANVITVEDTEMLSLPARAIHDLYHEDPVTFGLLILNIARDACRRLYKTDQVFLQYANRKKTA